MAQVKHSLNKPNFPAAPPLLQQPRKHCCYTNRCRSPAKLPVMPRCYGMHGMPGTTKVRLQRAPWVNYK